MRMTEAFIKTLKEEPAEAEVISHKLMIRASLIKKLGAGAYTYLPLGLKALRNVERIVRQEMDSSGAQEVLMPAIHPKELWDRTGRFDLMRDILITYKDRHGKTCVLGPTHEEVVTDLVARSIRSYRDLPRILYQIQTKFRDEPRPRFGVLRSKEFIMKDAYSFDRDAEGLDKSYSAVYAAYRRIFDRCGLEYVIVEADTGFMGGDVSHEFMVPSEIGEDIIALCPACGYAASADMAECADTGAGKEKSGGRESEAVKEVRTPGLSTVEKVSEFLKIKPERLVKTLIYKYDGGAVAVLLRGDHNLNEIKLKRHLGCEALEMADEGLIKSVTGGPMGFSGPVGLKGVDIIADYSVAGMTNFVTGANRPGTHLINVNLTRDFKVKEWKDLRYIAKGEPCPKCKKGGIKLETAIEVGHTFKLGTKYSGRLNAGFLDKDGKDKLCVMGCYGIGINRIIAAAIEQNNDRDGIMWPVSLAPYKAAVLPLNMTHKESVKIAEKIYKELLENKVEAMIDDRTESAGVKFKDADLIGYPVQVIIGEKGLAKKKIELKTRRGKKLDLVSEKDVIKSVLSKLMV